MDPTATSVFYNGTPHDIVVQCGEGTITFASRGLIRLAVAPSTPPKISPFLGSLGINFIASPAFTDVVGLPPFQEGLILLVSMPVGDRLALTGEWPGPVMGPDTGPDGAIRDDKGRIIGTKNLLVYKE